ncbi:MAG: Hsp33 family molecular chaperone HslO [Lachnospiraceae bacterium]|nr:Hsp33 family molecular chaperone HslO [Lachnospiraceae bacterium]NCD01747.1 Hsp33 family molecular chaperone HslO [Clostridia bacterium]
MTCTKPEQKTGVDYIIRATGANHQVRIFAASTREMVEYARQIHNTSPVATAALGRLLTAGAMMGCMQKGDKDILTLQIKCSGPIKGLTVTADAKANVKGYVDNPMVMLPPSPAGKLDVGKALDMGVLSVIKDLGLKEPYVGQTHLVSGEIAEDLTYYFATSEQVNSSVALGVLMEKDNRVKRAGGFILQLMPFAQEETIERLEKNIGKLPSVTTMLEEGNTPEDIIARVLDGMDVEVMDKLPTQFACNCTKDRVEKAIVSIGRDEIQAMIDDKEPIEVNCHFCNSHYIFSIDELKEILNRSK